MPISLDAILNETDTKEFPFGAGTVVVEFFKNASPEMRSNAKQRFGWTQEQLRERAETGNVDESMVAALAARIIKWDITDKDGVEVEVTEDVLRRSTDDFLIALSRAVFGGGVDESEGSVNPPTGDESAIT